MSRLHFARIVIVFSPLVACGLAWALRGHFVANGAASGLELRERASARERDAVLGARSDPIPQAGAPGPADLSPIRFTDCTGPAGIDFRHQTGTSPEKPFPAANGSGIAAFDYDLDGGHDLYFATGTPFPADPSRTAPRNRMYRNAGDWRFQDVTEQSGLGHNGFSAGLAAGDYDCDGFPDVYVTCYGANCLYRNQGDGTFRRIEASAGVDDPRWGTSAAFFDHNGDGFLDLYVCNYAEWTLETNQFCGDRGRNIRLYCNPGSVSPERDVFYLNGGEGEFRDVTDDVGLGARRGRGQGVLAADFDGDRLIDVYVANDLHPNFLYVNEGGSRFHDATDLSGAAFDFAGRSQAGMGVDAADVNRDGRMDLFVTNYEGEHNAFYENLGQGVFHDVSERCGLAADGRPWVGWGTALADFDLDGWDDLIVTNGHTDDNFHEIGRESPYAQPPLIWRNERGRFARIRRGAGSYFDETHVGRALTVVDLDNDGDHDVVIGHQDAAPVLLRNDRLSRPHEKSLQLRLIGTQSNRDAIGALVVLRSGDRTTTQQVKGGGSYLSAHDLRQILALAPGEADVHVEIQWPAGAQTILRNIRSGDSYLVVEPVNGSDGKLLPNQPTQESDKPR